jgi:hypothetical protein
MFKPRSNGFRDMSVSIISGPAGVPVLPGADLILNQLRDVALGKPAELFDAAVNPYLQGELAPQVDHPGHYRKDSGLEAIDAIEAWDLNFNLGNVVKYICRAGLKNNTDGLEDLEKALWYIQRELNSRTANLE